MHKLILSLCFILTSVITDISLILFPLGGTVTQKALCLLVFITCIHLHEFLHSLHLYILNTTLYMPCFFIFYLLRILFFHLYWVFAGMFSCIHQHLLNLTIFIVIYLNNQVLHPILLEPTMLCCSSMFWDLFWLDQLLSSKN